jgi:hypothetical protein
LVVRYPSFTWNPFHHSAHLPGSAVHLVGPNRTRIGGGRPSIYGISFRWQRRRGQIDHPQPTRAPCLVGWIPGAFPASISGFHTSADRASTRRAPLRLHSRSIPDRLAVAIARAHLPSPRCDDSRPSSRSIVLAGPDSHPLIHQALLTAGPPRRRRVRRRRPVSIVSERVRVSSVRPAVRRTICGLPRSCAARSLRYANRGHVPVLARAGARRSVQIEP